MAVGGRSKGWALKAMKYLGTASQKYGTVVDTMALRKKIPASIKNYGIALPQHGYVGTAAPPVTAVTSWELAANLDQLDIPSSAIIPTLAQGIINFIFWN